MMWNENDGSQISALYAAIIPFDAVISFVNARAYL